MPEREGERVLNVGRKKVPLGCRRSESHGVAITGALVRVLVTGERGRVDYIPVFAQGKAKPLC